jgi:hypothetical protein
MAETFGADDPLVQKVLAGKSPRDRAAELVYETTLGDVKVRRALAEGGSAAIAAAHDPMIELARMLDPESRELRKRYEDQIESRQRDGYAKIAAAKFAVKGESVYPDATFTLRLSYGQVAGWTEPDGRVIPSFTTLSGLGRRATGAAPFIMPTRWAAAYDRLDPDTIFNASVTLDVIGGFSGSPMLDTEGRVVGSAFDGNIHALGGEYFYDPEINRAVAITSTAIRMTLADVYGMNELLAELDAEEPEAAAPETEAAETE